MVLEMPLQPRFPRPGPRPVLQTVRRPVVSASAPAAGTTPSPGVKILVAGVDKDARAAVEAAVRQGLGPRAASGPWSISVVSLAGKWSVTLDGPGERLRGVSFVADPIRLAEAIREVAEGQEAVKTVPAAPEAAVALPTQVRERHLCESCGKAWLVAYESRPDEPRELAPVACPHCWRVGHVEIGAWAASGGDYQAERA
jgi:hypothetical protein